MPIVQRLDFAFVYVFLMFSIFRLIELIENRKNQITEKDKISEKESAETSEKEYFSSVRTANLSKQSPRIGKMSLVNLFNDEFVMPS